MHVIEMLLDRSVSFFKDKNWLKFCIAVKRPGGRFHLNQKRAVMHKKADVPFYRLSIRICRVVLEHRLLF
jgi:hypothetical protein